MKTKLKQLEEHFTLPFQPHDYQMKAAFEDVPILDFSLLKFKVGLGKTAASTFAALYASLTEGIEQIVILCPPILIDQWEAFLRSIKGIPSIGVYRGTPTERSKMKLTEAIIIASYNIFRQPAEFKKFKAVSMKVRQCYIADELSLKSLTSSTYKKVREIMYRKTKLYLGDEPFHKMIALNATPISDLMQVYNWCNLACPGLYQSLRMFILAHVDKQDHWGNVERWKNEDLMRRNLEIFSVDTDKDIILPPMNENVFPYKLTPAHMKLYKEVTNSELANLPREKAELAIRAMFSTLQRLVLHPADYGLEIESPILEYILGYIDQMDSEDSLLVFTRHVSISKMLSEKIPNCGAIYGGVSKKEREIIFEKIARKDIRVLVANMDSCGHGLNLQMFNHQILAEIPFRADRLTQVVGRSYRQGQEKPCYVNIPLAIGTLQRRIHTNMVQNGFDINKVLHTKEDVVAFLLDED